MPLQSLRFQRTGSGEASAYAAHLLRLLGAHPSRSGDKGPHGWFVRLDESVDATPGTWASSGAMSLTGHHDRPPLDPGGPVIRRMIGAGAAAQIIASAVGVNLHLDAPALLGERAAFTGLSRRGRTSIGGSCELLQCSDGWIALNLPRTDDIELVPAWLCDDKVLDPSRNRLRRAVRQRTVSSLVSSAQALGLAVSPLTGNPGDDARQTMTATAPFRVRPTGWPSASDPVVPTRWVDGRRPLVVDMTGLWAGPLVGSLLASCGARVVKVESRARPDGARAANDDFFNLLNGSKLSVDLDPREPVGHGRLRALLLQADLVIESFRPHVMPRLGLARSDLMVENPRQSWLSITAQDRRGPAAERPGYGDDIAVSAGFVAYDDAGDPVFCADAAADPMSGLVGFVAALGCLVGQGGHHIDLCMSDVVASLTMSWDCSPTTTSTHPDTGIAAPRSRSVKDVARPLGSDTAAVLRALDIP